MVSGKEQRWRDEQRLFLKPEPCRCWYQPTQLVPQSSIFHGMRASLRLLLRRLLSLRQTESIYRHRHRIAQQMVRWLWISCRLSGVRCMYLFNRSPFLVRRFSVRDIETGMLVAVIVVMIVVVSFVRCCGSNQAKKKQVCYLHCYKGFFFKIFENIRRFSLFKQKIETNTINLQYLLLPLVIRYLVIFTLEH